MNGRRNVLATSHAVDRPERWREQRSCCQRCRRRRCEEGFATQGASESQWVIVGVTVCPNPGRGLTDHNSLWGGLFLTKRGHSTCRGAHLLLAFEAEVSSSEGVRSAAARR
jgi:hypothetical protein